MAKFTNYIDSFGCRVSIYDTIAFRYQGRVYYGSILIRKGKETFRYKDRQGVFHEHQFASLQFDSKKDWELIEDNRVVRSISNPSVPMK